MEKLKLLRINKKDDMVTFIFSYTKGLSKYFTGKKFTIHYPINIDEVPDSVLVIPFLSNIIQLIWVTDSIIEVPTLDKNFFNSLPELKKAYSKMFPETKFAGELIVNKIEENKSSSNNKSAMFFSGGADSIQTLVSHYHENIDLITIWGSDIKYNNTEGWNILYKTLHNSAKDFGLNLYTIHSSFRDFDDEKVLYKDFFDTLKDSWWHGLQHGLGLLGHAAPLAYRFGYKYIYIASSHSTHDTNVRCSSHPTTDNCIKFCNCQVVHDGFEFKRQDKIKNVIEFSNSNPTLPIKLHVCWKTQTGENCCVCEKCARTIYSIVIEGGDPRKFGFHNFESAFSMFDKKRTLIYLAKHPLIYHHWFDIAERAKELKNQISSSPYYKNIKWLLKIKRDDPKSYRALKRRFRMFVHRVIDKIKHDNERRKYNKALKIKFKLPNRIVLFGTPTHCNIGDEGIAQAEIDFLNNIGKNVVEITVNEWKKYKNIIVKKIKNNELLLLHGGGNFGNLWPYEESIREDIIKAFPTNQFVLMPQTFYITDCFSENSLAEMQNKYSNVRFDLFARERFSFEKMSSIFPDAKCYLVPDIVLYEKSNLKSDFFNINKNIDVLLVLRSDREGILDYDDIVNIQNYLKKENLSCKFSDMLYHLRNINKEDRNEVICQKLKEFASSKVIITDRLHGMVFAFLANVPCIVLQNNNYKITGVYDWIKNSGSVFLANGIDEIPVLIKKTLNIKVDNSFDNRLFDKLKNVIIDGGKNGGC